MLEALADPDHESHAETRKWLGEDFDPHAFDAGSESRRRRRQTLVEKTLGKESRET